MACLVLTLSMHIAHAQRRYTEFRAEAGVTLSKISNWGIGSFLPGFRLGGSAVIPLSRYSTFSLVPGLILTTKGEKQSFHGAKGVQSNTSLLYLQLPIEAAVQVDFDDINRFYFSTGPYVAYGLSGKLMKRDDLFSPLKTGLPAPFKRLEVGWGANIAYNYDNIYVKLGLDYSLMGVMNVGSGIVGSSSAMTSSKHGVMYLSVGYQF